MPRPTDHESFERDSASFWSGAQPGFRFASAPAGTPEFFAEVEAHRYALEPHIREIVGFGRWAGRDVLEAGCGIGTDGIQFARAGSRYVGLDLSAVALDLARRRFDLEGLPARFVEGSVLALPFERESFDLVYSHGLIHHVADPGAAVEEIHRVLRPGGTALVMVYHRNSLNYRFTIMLVRRLLAALLLLPRGVKAVARLTGESPELLSAHRDLLRRHGRRYLADGALFLSKNTDGPENPLSVVFSRREAVELFGSFADTVTNVRFLNLRIFPGGERLAATALAHRLEPRLGWHLYVEAVKAR